MTCCTVDKQTNFDREIALSFTKCNLENWDELSKAAACSTAACSDSCAASCSAMRIPGLSLPLKGAKACWADWDDKTTNPSPRSSMSLCDEPAENDLADYDLAEDEPTHFLANEDTPSEYQFAETLPAEYELGENAQPKSKLPTSRPAWADLVDSDSDETASVKAQSSESQDEDEGGQSSPVPNRRPSRAARASKPIQPAARTAAAADEQLSGGSVAGKGADAPFAASDDHTAEEDDHASRNRRANKGTGKAGGKGGNKGDNIKGVHADGVKGAAKGSGKRADKGAGKGGKGSDKQSDWQSAEGAGKGGKGSDKQSNWQSADKGSGKGAGKAGKSNGKGKGKAKGKGKGKTNDCDKFQCQINIGIEEESKFRVVRRMIGAGGENMKNIHEQSSGARLRLRGRGSKFLEGDEQLESTDDLMLCITCDDKAGYEIAKVMAVELVEGVQKNYRSFCRARGWDCPDLDVHVHEGYRAGSR